MDTAAPAISVANLSSRLGSPHAPLIVDVRRAPAFDADSTMIAGALRRHPDEVSDWARQLPGNAPVVAYCAHGHEVSQGVAKALGDLGIDARFLAGGIEAWKAAGGPTMAKQTIPGFPSSRPTRWVTRERPKIDRIACPWLVRRFIDRHAEFLFVPANQVLAAAERDRAVPYDIPGVEFSHEGELCSFDAFLKRFRVDDPALDDLAVIVRGADTARPDLAPQCAGLLAVSLGLSALYDDDIEMLERGMLVYDALYAWIKSARAEVHNARLFEKT